MCVGVELIISSGVGHTRDSSPRVIGDVCDLDVFNCQSFSCKKYGFSLSSFICSLLWNIHVFAFEMHCSMLLIVSTISDGLHDL